MPETNVISIIEDLTFIHPVVIPWGRIVLISAATVGFIAAMVLIVRRVQHLRRIAQEMRTPERAALAALDRVFAAWREIGHRACLEEVTTILRSYLNRRFGLNAPVHTVRQITESLATAAILDPHQQDELKTLLRRCDELKFGLASTRETELDQLHSSAKNFIHQTAWRKKSLCN